MLKFRQRPLLLFIVTAMAMLAACRTNTVIDSLFYDSEIISLSYNGSEVNSLCRAIQRRGYLFSEFDVYTDYVLVSYPNGETQSYEDGIGIGITAMTLIGRDFDTLTLPEEELVRLARYARELCFAAQEEAREFSFTNVDVGMVLHDPINGVTIVYNTENFSGECSTITSGYYGFGAYGTEEQLTDSICPDT
jgi:hypothetical protein